eukprot:118113-Amphidinium_carterae.1
METQLALAWIEQVVTLVALVSQTAPFDLFLCVYTKAAALHSVTRLSRQGQNTGCPMAATTFVWQ